MSSRSAESVKDLLPRSYRFLREVTSSIRGKVGFSVTLVFVLMATIGPIVLPLEFTSFNLEKAYSPPSFEHPLGCDYFGRDVLRMIIAGSREVLMVGILAALLTTAIALIIGLTAGFMSGVVDATLMTIADIVLTIPGFPLLLVLASTVLSKAMDPLSLAGVLSITAWAGLSRSIRSQVLAIKEREFIEAARCLGLRRIQIIFVEILPNLLPYIVTITILGVTGAIYAQIGLFTLGVAPYSSINWGVMLNNAIQQAGAIHSTKYMNLLAPAFFIILLQLGLITLSGSLDETLNPRLRTK
ncbi:MAG: ABC transporter permease [Candidatus Bathyarchaeota archaeon]|nr:ABC transporter permease [Candidatus Bathyarchaeota archaeon]